MPITIKLSKAFYDAVGEQAANELVDWLNTVDKSAHSEISETMDRAMVRLEARLDKGIADLRSELNAFRSEFTYALGELRSETRDSQSALRSETRDSQGALRSELKGEITDQISIVRGEIASMRAELLKWMFIFWIGSVATWVGLSLTLFGR